MYQANSAAPELARGALASLAIAMTFHLVASVDALLRPRHTSSLSWALLAAAELALALVVLSRPRDFQIRRFRLPGFAVVSTALIILAPLPSVSWRFGALIPETVIPGFAGGLAMMAAVMFLMTVQPHRPKPLGSGCSAGRGGSPGLVVAAGEVSAVRAILFFALALLPLWLRAVGSVPLFALFGDGGNELTTARQQSLTDLSSVPLRLAVGSIRNLYLIFAAAWLVADLRGRPREARSFGPRRALAVVGVGLAVGYALITTEKAIIGEVLIACVVAAYTVRNKDIGGKSLAMMGSGVVAFPLIFSFIVGGGVSIAIQAVRRRIFFLPSDVMARYFNNYQGREPFLWGASIPKVPRLFGKETFDLSGHIYDLYYSRGSGINGNANAFFGAVGWANGGVIGVIIWFGMCGAGLIWLDRHIDTLPSRWSAALRGVAIVQTLLLTSADIFRSLLSIFPGFLDLVVLAALVKALDLNIASRPRTRPGPLSPFHTPTRSLTIRGKT